MATQPEPYLALPESDATLILGGINNGWYVDPKDHRKRIREASAEEIEAAKRRYWNL